MNVAATLVRLTINFDAMENYRIFIVEDDPWYGEILTYHLSLNPDHEVTLFSSGEECLEKMHLNPNLVTIDFSLPDMQGDVLFKKILELKPDVPVIMISSQEDITVAVNLMKQGVRDYLVKDEATKDLLWNSVIRVKENQSLIKEVEELKEELGQKYSFETTMIGQSESLRKVFGLMNKALKTTINVSITGETGTGKELVAKGIHYNSDRKKKKFIAVNMVAIPSELIESELFGHEKGSFTGATVRKIGKFEEASGGTLFLDEIAEIDLTLQTKLLRVLQERELQRVGGNETVKIDVRLITATHKNLADEVHKGNFREDLYFRIMGLPIELPPLRNRGNDILILAKHFADDFAKENKLGQIKFHESAKAKLMSYNYPGNIRELKASIELAAVLCTDELIEAHDISFIASHKDPTNLGQKKTLREHTCDIVKYYLDQNNRDILKTAKVLDIGKSTIYKMIQEGEIDMNS